MAQKIVKHVKDMVAEANKEVEITPVVDASKYFEDSQYVFVDIRDPREIQREGKKVQNIKDFILGTKIKKGINLINA